MATRRRHRFGQGFLSKIGSVCGMECFMTPSQKRLRSIKRRKTKQTLQELLLMLSFQCLFLILILGLFTPARMEVVSTNQSGDTELSRWSKWMSSKREKEKYLKTLPANVRIMYEVAEVYKIKPEHLIAVSLAESDLCKQPIGDGGISRGCFHINIQANPEARPLIGDVKKESTWAAKKLLAYGYGKGKVMQAFNQYNCPSCNPATHTYAEKVERKIKTAKRILHL